MLDSTLNNMANKGDIGNTTYSDFTPFNSKEHYHQDCPSYSGYITDYSVPNNYQNVCYYLSFVNAYTRS